MLKRSIVLSCGLVILTGCGADEISSPGTGGDINITNPPAPTPPPPPPPPAVVSPAAGCPTIAATPGLADRGTITGPTGEYRICALPTRFTASSTLPYVEGLLYMLDGRVDVGTDGGPVPSAADTNVTLTIEPGAMFYASGPSFLMVNRGNQIDAVGTPEMPIIFTSRDNVLGLNEQDSSGQWGGVVLAGRAPVTDCTVAPDAPPGSASCERQVEGAAQPAHFGGATDDDSSGRMHYVQIRYSGFVLSADNELQSLTTGGTGTGTELSHIMSYNSSDDGVEFFGGYVNAKNLIVVGSEDDALDTDTGVQANLQYVIAVSRANAGDTIIEADSSNARIADLPRQKTQISNATFVYNGATRDQAIRIRGGADYAIVNSVLVDATESTPCLRIDDTETNDATPPVFNSFVLDCPTAFRDGADVTAAEAEAIFDAGSNNNAGYTSTLTGLFINGSNESGIPAFDPTALSSFFDNASYIGAVRDASDTWYAGWTCNSATANFGTNVGDCTSLPVY